MKRIANNVAVQTVLYTIKPDQKVKVVEYSNYFDCDKGRNGTTLYEGAAGGLCGYEYVKATHRVVRLIRTEQEAGEIVVVFVVFPEYEF